MIVSDSVVAPYSLLLYETLLSRRNPSPQEKHQYKRLYKGFTGEKILEEKIGSSKYTNILPLYGCLFEVDETEFQIDCLLLTTNTIYILEVKNYTGDYYVEKDKIFNVHTKTDTIRFHT